MSFMIKYFKTYVNKKNYKYVMSKAHSLIQEKHINYLNKNLIYEDVFT
jgi:hypothetical protein